MECCVRGFSPQSHRDTEKAPSEFNHKGHEGVGVFLFAHSSHFSPQSHRDTGKTQTFPPPHSSQSTALMGHRIPAFHHRATKTQSKALSRLTIKGTKEHEGVGEFHPHIPTSPLKPKCGLNGAPRAVDKLQQGVLCRSVGSFWIFVSQNRSECEAKCGCVMFIT